MRVKIRRNCNWKEVAENRKEGKKIYFMASWS